MRAARFAAQLGFDVEMDVMTAMEEMASRLEIVSAERVRAELERLLISPWPRRGLELMVHTGVADVVLPELSALRETVDEHRRHKDVYEHTLTVLDQAIDLETGPDGPVPGPDLVLRLAAILHDIGKPATRRFLPDGTVTFHGHDHVGARMTAKRLRALRFDKQTVKDVSRLVELHLRFHGYVDAAWSDSAVRRYATDAGPLLERLHRLTRADVTTRNRRKAAMLDRAYDDLEERIESLRAAEELAAIRPDLDGGQIMAELGVAPGPVVGEAYRFLMDLRMEKGRSERTWPARHCAPGGRPGRRAEGEKCVKPRRICGSVSSASGPAATWPRSRTPHRSRPGSSPRPTPRPTPPSAPSGSCPRVWRSWPTTATCSDTGSTPSS